MHVASNTRMDVSNACWRRPPACLCNHQRTHDMLGACWHAPRVVDAALGADAGEQMPKAPGEPKAESPAVAQADALDAADCLDEELLSGEDLRGNISY